MKATTHQNSVSRSALRHGSFLTALVLACLALPPQARAVCQEGCDLGNGNTFLGDDALVNNNPFGGYNTATGSQALFSNTSGSYNTANGFNALYSNTGGIQNTATGFNALHSNTAGNSNTANGSAALSFNDTGIQNTASGAGALQFNTTGSYNTATGVDALVNGGNGNTATGVDALLINFGNGNTASGSYALLNNRTGSKNIALGFRAGSNLTTGDNNIDIGNAGQAGESSTIRIGRAPEHTATFIAGIAGATVPAGVAVIVNASGHLGTITSSERFKDAIKPMDKASEAILALQPVTFRYKRELDPAGIPQFGLIAEDVEKANPDLVARDERGKPYSVRYEAVNAMLLNEFLKEHRKVEKQEATIERLQKQVEALTADLQKVSAQLEIMKPTPRTVSNDR
jgi:hypothetical protein